MQCCWERIFKKRSYHRPKYFLFKCVSTIDWKRGKRTLFTFEKYPFCRGSTDVNISHTCTYPFRVKPPVLIFSAEPSCATTLNRTSNNVSVIVSLSWLVERLLLYVRERDLLVFIECLQRDQQHVDLSRYTHWGMSVTLVWGIAQSAQRILAICCVTFCCENQKTILKK